MLRSRELAPPALWNDDAWVALISRHPWRDIWFTSATSVGFRAVIGVWIAIFGDAPVVAQIIPFTCGLASIPIIYWLSRRLGMQRGPALFAAGLVAGSPILVTYSTRVKQYTGDALGSMVIAASVTWLIENPRESRRWWVFTLVSTGAAVFSGQLMLVAVPAALVALAGSWHAWRDCARAAVPALSILVAACTLWYWAVLLPRIEREPVAYWATYYLVVDEGVRPAVRSLGLGLSRLVAGAIGSGTFHLVGASVLAMAALAWRPALTVALLLPVLATIAVAAAGRAPIGARTDAYLVPLVALVMAAGLDALLRADLIRVPSRLRQPVRYAAIGICVGLLLIGARTRTVPRPYPHEDVRSLTRIWEARRQPDDRTLVMGQAGLAFALYSREPLVTVRNGRPLKHAVVDSPTISVLPRSLHGGSSHMAPGSDGSGARRSARMSRKGRAASADREGHRDDIALPLDANVERIWILGAGDRGDLPLIKARVTALGFVARDRWGTDGTAELSLYQRTRADR
jgi:hypothetical protein